MSRSIIAVLAVFATVAFVQTAGAATKREAMFSVKQCLIAKDTHFRYVGSRGNSGRASFMSNYGYGGAKWTYQVRPNGQVKAVTAYSFLDTREPSLPAKTKAVVRRCVFSSV